MDPKAAAHLMSAFPTFAKSGDVALCEGGLTMRDWFAAQALSGICHMIGAGKHELGLVRPNGAAGIAHTAYELADAMIKAREA